MQETPYDTICNIVEEWCSKNYYTDFIVTILINGIEISEFLEFDGETMKFLWLNDWWEGEKDVQLLGFAPIRDIQLHNYPQQTNGDRIRQMTDEELATFIVKDMECSNLIEDAKCLKYRKIKRCDCEQCWLDWLRREVNDGD